jgi:hypothetical protein
MAVSWSHGLHQNRHRCRGARKVMDQGPGTTKYKAPQDWEVLSLAILRDEARLVSATVGTGIAALSGSRKLRADGIRLQPDAGQPIQFVGERNKPL